MKVGIAGTGRMGAAIARRLIQCGRDVTVWNRTAAKTEALAADGAHVAATPAELAAGSDIVITLLTDATAIDAAYRGARGLLADDIRGKLFVEMSTVRPETERALAADVEARGARLIDCPVGGTVGPAYQGKLIALVGGESADVAHAMPLLDQLCRRAEHVGPVGAGAAMKLAINLPMHVYWQALREALALCKPLGLAPARLLDIFADTSGAPSSLRARAGAIAAVLEGKEQRAADFDIGAIRKDLQTMIAEARALGRSLPVAECALECFDDAAQRGLGPSSGAALLTLDQRRARDAAP